MIHMNMVKKKDVNRMDIELTMNSLDNWSYEMKE